MREVLNPLDRAGLLSLFDPREGNGRRQMKIRAKSLIEDDDEDEDVR